LISTKLVVTAAHCVHYKKDPLVRKAEEASFYIGKYNLESLNEKNYIVSGVSQLSFNVVDNKNINAAYLLTLLSNNLYLHPY
jgi:hypothetical protein